MSYSWELGITRGGRGLLVGSYSWGRGGRGGWELLVGVGGLEEVSEVEVLVHGNADRHIGG